MDEQQSIFDTTFDNNLNIRRRELLPLALKIYVWVFMVLGAIFILGACFSVTELVKKVTGGVMPEGDIEYILYISTVVAGFLPGMVFLSISIPVWREAKWAIRTNWVFAVILTAIMIINTINFSRGLMSAWVIVIPLTVFLPYWILLFRIRKQWEQVATAKK